MRLLLLHPEDPPRQRTHNPWDLIVDLGRAPESFYNDWSRTLGCPIFSIFDFAVEVKDLIVWRGPLRLGLGHVVDRLGVDWWDVIGLLLRSEMQDLVLAQRLAKQIQTCESLAVTRPSLVANALQLLFGCPLEEIDRGPRRFVGNLRRYRRAASSLSFRQLRQVVYDKYDSGYRWRRRFAARQELSSSPVVLLPSAYSNVSRTACHYAEILPNQRFLLVFARETAEIPLVPANVETAALAAFAPHRSDSGEVLDLQSAWDRLQGSLRSKPEFELGAQLGVLEKGKQWLRWGVRVRDAWNAVFKQQRVNCCLSADDSNPYSRIPLLLADHYQLPTIACHHGALDAIMALKNPAYSTYLVKGDMEYDYLERVCKVDASRLRIGAASRPPQDHSLWSDGAPWIVFFTEPYETDLWRSQAVYREVFPRLIAAARKAGKKVVIKLHPFESVSERQRMINRSLSKDDGPLVSITAAPLSRDILGSTWCCVTVESTTAFECATAGIPAFLCGWLRHAYFGYVPQFARFGVGRMLESPDELLNIPDMVKTAIPSAGLADRLVQAITPRQFSEILCHRQANGLR